MILLSLAQMHLVLAEGKRPLARMERETAGGERMLTSSCLSPQLKGVQHSYRHKAIRSWKCPDIRCPPSQGSPYDGVAALCPIPLIGKLRLGAGTYLPGGARPPHQAAVIRNKDSDVVPP
jgi:hypothetical protein